MFMALDKIKYTFWGSEFGWNQTGKDPNFVKIEIFGSFLASKYGKIPSRGS